MINKTKWRDEQQFSKKIVYHLKNLGYMVNRIEPNAAAGATIGMPDLMIVSPRGGVRLIELKCIEKPKNEPRDYYQITKDTQTRFSLKDSQLLKFYEFKQFCLPVWILVAEKGTANMAVTNYGLIQKKQSQIFMQYSTDYKEVFRIMGIYEDVVDQWKTNF